MQIDVKIGDKEANFRQVKEWMELAYVDSKLPTAIILPELWTTGYDLEREAVLASEDGKETSLFLGELAKKYGTWFIGGSTLSKNSGGYSNRAQVINPNGELITYYDKVHLIPLMDEHKYFVAGRKDCIFDWEGTPSGCVICYDLRFGEWLRNYALKGVKVLFISAEWPEIRAEHWNVLLRARAIENQLYIVSCNRCGTSKDTKFSGGSLVVDPWGKILLNAGTKDGLSFQCFDLDKVDEARAKVPVFKDRVPTLYSQLTKEG
jgi:predicted amidohydrolase